MHESLDAGRKSIRVIRVIRELKPDDSSKGIR